MEGLRNRGREALPNNEIMARVQHNLLLTAPDTLLDVVADTYSRKASRRSNPNNL